MSQELTTNVSLPALVRRAADTLSSATTAAEVLDARDLARVAYDAAKSAARFAMAKEAHDDVISAVYRAQADALEIEATAKRRLADEYDAAQARGDIAGEGRPKTVSDGNSIPTAADMGLNRKDIYEGRLIREAEEADPGVVRRTLDQRIKAGQEPTKASLRQALRGYVPEPALCIPEQSLWFWGRLRDFDEEAVLDATAPELLDPMTDGMRQDVLRIAPRLAELLGRVMREPLRTPATPAD